MEISIHVKLHAERYAELHAELCAKSQIFFVLITIADLSAVSGGFKEGALGGGGGAVNIIQNIEMYGRVCSTAESTRSTNYH